MPQKYFRVCADWMKTYPFENLHGTSKVFQVLYVRVNHGPEDVVILKCPSMVGGEWAVFAGRGHYVCDWTLMLVDGLFVPVPADTEECGGDLRSHSEFDTFEQAQSAATRFNEAIRASFIKLIPKAQIDDVPLGGFCRRLGSDGMPVARTYRRELFDQDKGKYVIVDPLDSDKKLWIKSGETVAVDLYV